MWQLRGRSGAVRSRFAYRGILQLRHRAADGPGNFFARSEAVRIAAAWINDVFAASQVVKTPGLPTVAAARRQQPINTLHNFARLHFLCTVSAEAAKFIVLIAKSRCDRARQS